MSAGAGDARGVSCSASGAALQRRERDRLILHSHTRSLTRPIVDYLRAVAAESRHDRIVVLIPEMHLPKLWQRLLQNQRGAVLDRATRRDTDVVICRLRLPMPLHPTTRA